MDEETLTQLAASRLALESVLSIVQAAEAVTDPALCKWMLAEAVPTIEEFLKTLPDRSKEQVKLPPPKRVSKRATRKAQHAVANFLIWYMGALIGAIVAASGDIFGGLLLFAVFGCAAELVGQL